MKSEEEEVELSMTGEQLQHWVQEEVDRDERLVQRRAQLAQVEDWVKRKESEATYTRLLYNNTYESVLECESVMKGLYGMLGLEYRDTDSEEEEGATPDGVIQIADDGEDMGGDGYVVDKSSEEKPKVQKMSANVQMSSKPSSSQPLENVMAVDPSRIITSAFTPHKNSSFTAFISVTEMESRPSGSLESSDKSLPTIKTRESPVPIRSAPSPDLSPSTSFRPVSSSVKRESSPSRSPEPSDNFLPTIKTRESPVPLSGPLSNYLPPTSFTPVILPTKTSNSPSGSPEPSINSEPTIKTRESPVPFSSIASSNVLLCGTFEPVTPLVKTEISPSRKTETSDSLLPNIKSRESPVPISSAPSPDVLSSPSSPILPSSTPSCMSESPPLSMTSAIPSAPVKHTETLSSKTFATAEQNSETPAQLGASIKTSAPSAKSPLASTSSERVSLNQRPVCSSAGSNVLTSDTAGETTTIEKAKSTSLTPSSNLSQPVTCSAATPSTSTSKAADSRSTNSPSVQITTTSNKPSDTREASQKSPACVQKEVKLKVNMSVLGRRRTKTWHEGTILEIRATETGNRYKVKFEGDKGKSMLSAHHLASVGPPVLKDLFVGCRVVARYREQDQSWLHAAVITEMPDRKNRMRFMVFFDDGRAAYVSLPDLHLVCSPLKNVYEDIEDEACRTEVREYLEAYPNPIFVVVRVGQESRVERDGEWIDCTITQVDGSLIQICYTESKEKEWLYKGSNKLDHIQRIKKRMAKPKTDQPSNRAVCASNQRNTNTATNTTTTTTTTATARVTTQSISLKNQRTTDTTTTTTTTTTTATATATARVITQSVSLKPSAPRTVTPSVTQAVTTNASSKVIEKTAAIPSLQPKVVLNRISLSVSSSNITLSTVSLHTEPRVTSLLNKGAKRPGSVEVDFYKNVPSPVVEPRLKYVPHRCCPACLDQMKPAQKDQHRGQNPLLIPLLYGFRRMTSRRRLEGKVSFHVFYRTPCGRSMSRMEEVQDFLFESRCDFLFLDMFCLDPFVLVKRALPPASMSNRPYLFLPDISEGKEVISVPCVNEVDETPPPRLNYTRHRVPAPGVFINTSPDFLVGCDCTDGCQNRSTCSCHQLTTGAASLFTGGPEDVSAGYTNKRLTKYVPTGVYECNSLCRCDPWTCSNRLVQHGLQLRLQVFMTQHKGWGIRCLDDISKGTFVCVFTGKIVTDDLASTEASMSGNEYLANLDYIEEVEKLKEGYESEAYWSEEESDKKTLIRMTTGSLKKQSVLTVDSSNDEEVEVPNQQKSATNVSEDESDCSDYSDHDTDDEDYVVSSDEAQARRKHIDVNCQRSYVTRRNARILNDCEDSLNDVHSTLPQKLAEEKTEVSSFMANEKKKEGESETGLVQKSSRNFAIKSFHRKVKQQEVSSDEPQKKKAKLCRRSTRRLFDDEKACFLIDAKQEGNIARFINHSCSPNLFVQNVFVDTHDLRFPWVAFFTSKRIRAGTELTWDYSYEVGSVEGKVLLCCCGSAECTGRLL